MKFNFLCCIVFTELLLLFGDLVCASQNDDTGSSQNITVEPDKIKSASGGNIEVKCTSLLEGQDIAWISPNGTYISDMSSPRFNDTNGHLTITDIKTYDSGTYVCSVGKTLNASASITIYDMPNYFTEGMIILGINVALILVFLGCLTHTTIQNRRAKAQYDKVKISPSSKA